ncbi:hypothetical protein KC19_4G228600 [Ceratodon purpureus]|uniref:RING-type domain-containing protein n=1 Tax=Ceratodon purpureus TaxID=3225 RepID=A0A8T0IF67_CERPU|nr:hypothetical protein KC19_4G228600 [Ceratodon purpureus]
MDIENLSVLNSGWLSCGSSASSPSSVIDDSSTCPICFALMKPPHLAPIILTPCGHTFCAKCIAVHTAVQRKKARLVGGPISAPPCPQCKATIMAQCVNITLQNIITERLAIEENMRRAEIESIYPKTPVRGQLLYEELVTSRKADFARTARDKFGVHVNTSPGPLCCHSLQDALLETRHRQDRLEMDLSSAEEKLNLLDSREKELKQILQKASLEHRMVQSELEDTKSKKGMLHQAHADTLKKSQLIEASMVAMTFEKVE